MKMNKKFYRKCFLSSSLAFIILVMFSFPSIGAVNFKTLDEEEQGILEKMFTLMQEIEEADRLKSELTTDIEKLNQEVENLEMLIGIETLTYEKDRNRMEAVLKTYQRSGPGSYLELILSSDNLTTLLRRFNILRDITSKTDELLASLQESKTKLDSDKRKVSNHLALIQDKQKKLKETLEKGTKLNKDLVSLEQEQIEYQEYLSNINQIWLELKPLFSEIVTVFAHTMEEGNLPQDAIKIDYSFLSIKSVIDEQTFNDIISKQAFPTKLEFIFSQDKLEMVMPEKNICLSGTFAILEGQKLVFKVNEGRFFGMPLEKSAIEDLFSEGYLELNLEPLLGKSRLKSIDIHDDDLELQITW